jgi:hypothetical protein
MPTMRHPGGAGPYEAQDVQVSMMRRGGWLTREEWEQREDLPKWEPEPEPDDQEQDDEPKDEPDDDSGEQKTKPTRSKPRATSKKESD